MFTRQHLDQTVLDIEFVLLAVVQGVALTALGIEAMPVLREPAVVPCVLLVTGLLFVFAFWAGALLHAVSIVRWPIDLPHYFFYFAIGLLEMITFTQLRHPQAWFLASLVFYMLGTGLYAYDLSLMHGMRPMYERAEATRLLYLDVLARQRFELRVIMPGGLGFSLVAWWFVRARPETALPFAVLQLLFTAGFLSHLVRVFRRRVRLISATIESEG